MQLYYVVGSPNCRKVHAVINHLNLKVDFEYLDFFTGDLKKPEYLAINPNGMVPALRDGSFTLWESNAIMQYLAGTAGDTPLFPRNERTRADIARWLTWEVCHFNKAFGNLAFEAVAKPGFMGAPPDAVIVATAQKDLARFAPVLEAHLQGRSHLVGNDVTLADYAMIHVEGFKEGVPFDWSGFPNINAYFARMRTVPHWARTAPPSPQAIGRKPAQPA